MNVKIFELYKFKKSLIEKGLVYNQKENIDLIKKIIHFYKENGIKKTHKKIKEIEKEFGMILLDSIFGGYLYSESSLNNMLKQNKEKIEEIEINLSSFLDFYKDSNASFQILFEILSNLKLENILLNKELSEKEYSFFEKVLFLEKADNNTNVVLNMFSIKEVLKYTLEEIVLLYMEKIKHFFK
jgi:hypothetical protein